MDIGRRKPPVEYDASEMDAASTPSPSHPRLPQITGAFDEDGGDISVTQEDSLSSGVHRADHVHNNPERVVFINFMKSQHQPSYFPKWETQNINFMVVFW
ncbi:hypothetical protein N7450_008424 [Penicillium hetheringtonii]|uniref:Uncharacterized protein n=1 Tax=Penicillium hetheringtonii TaxID=911720 RepID=A0AAD6DD67_9EURO|nr:hypothetical protein N7450_008424 [Penicillium hetheringtonii]